MKILSTLLDIATTVLRLLEAEGRVLRKAVMNVGWALACVGAAFLLVLVAAGFFLAGIYQFLAAQLSPVAASLLVSLVAVLLAVLFAFMAKRLTADAS
jgi:hypothetical protein